MADGDNYSGFTARAEPPAGGSQRVSVSGNVLVDPAASASLSQTTESGGSESALFLQLNLSGGGSGDPGIWVPVAFSGPVQLQGSNPITEVEITSDELGDCTVEVDSPGGGHAASTRASSAGSAAQPGRESGKPGAASDGGESNYSVVQCFTHQFHGTLQMAVVYGYVRVANPGLQPVLRNASRGEGGGILALELDLWQRPGPWEQKESWVPFNYGVTLMQTFVTETVISSAQLGDLTVPAEAV